ncbi:glycosyltransferase [Acidimicrobiia bacterium]|nr:glycosyltransferase [Acidimicrobiia bacterium]
MNQNKKISVIMSVYNNENSIQESVKSIMNQTYSNFELLIIDDCSKDDSYKICEQIANLDSRIKLFKNNTNIGLTKSLNKLIEISTGDYIARQDGDDVSSNSRFAIQLTQMQQLGLDACTTRAFKMNTRSKIPGLSYFIPLKLSTRFKNPFIHGSLMIDKQVMDSIDRYNEDYYYAQDYKLMTDLLRQNYRIKIINQTLYHLNMDNNISTNYTKEQREFFKKARSS